MNKSSPDSLVSVIIPVGERHSDMTALFEEYRRGIAATQLNYEFIVVLDGPHDDVAQALQPFIAQGERLTVVSLTRRFGEATALMAGFEHAAGEIILTLPAYFQIEPAGIGLLLGALERCDITSGHRTPRAGGFLERLRRNSFHGLLGMVTGQKLRDLGCGARAMRRIVLEEITLYGDQHRFLPVLAHRQGFRAAEVDVQQSPRDRFEGMYRPREYAHRALDIFTVFFLVRFTKKPLRFFGMVGAGTFALGAALLTYLVFVRAFFGQPLADRPALLLSSLLVVLGLQVFALGLLGELIIFTHAKATKDYQVDRVIQFDSDDESSAKPAVAREVAGNR
jgi:glycosyltransferase involved in cell wall biosynthesis